MAKKSRKEYAYCGKYHEPCFKAVQYCPKGKYALEVEWGKIIEKYDEHMSKELPLTWKLLSLLTNPVPRR